ncbi:Uncharacterised protein [uncultured archaeon]|nr:Uncharacterised protein [uncultured archaeon]
MVKVEVMMDEKAVYAKSMLNLRLVKLSWALFFILVGGSWILDNVQRINDTQMWALIYAGSGAILLLLNVLRIIWKIQISRFSIGLGALGLMLGIAKYYSLGNISILAAIFLIIGIFMLFEVLRR